MPPCPFPLWVLLSVACRSDPIAPQPSGTPPDRVPTADTGASPVPSTSGAGDCTPTDNPLRASCRYTADRAGPLTVRFEAPGAATRTFDTDIVAIEHEVLAWGLQPDTVYTWTMGTAQGTHRTGSLPADLAAADIQVTGVATGFDAVVHPLPCASGTMYFVMIEGDGDIVWFEGTPDYAGVGAGYQWSAEDRSVLVTSPDRLVEIDVAGTERLRLEQGVHFDGVLHHDVARHAGVTYLLSEYPGQGTWLDRIDAFDGTTWLGAWRMEDDFVVAGGGGGGAGWGDWAHANGLNATSTGELVLSSFVFDTVIGIDGDRDAPSFLDLSWHADGSGDGLPDPDFVAADVSSAFSGQHAASRRGDELWLFDNTGTGNGSRGLRLEMDADRGLVTALDAWDLGVDCPHHGGAFPLDDDGVVLTCAATGEVWRFAAGATTASWTLRATCGGATGPVEFTKATPVTIR